ncbi:hypothetical protein ACFXQA_02235 [Microbacterium sp. P07]|uniref:hypothetical protein n=1 Tax=Microbacterium sp. P07 TaxID=3366952 RepID=UPI003744D195
MTTPLSALLAQVDALNDPESPFAFHVEGDRIVGTWDIAHILYVGLLGAGKIDETYRIEVEFQPDEATYELEEHQRSSDLEGGITTGGTIRFGGSTEGFRGKQTRIQKGFVAAPYVRTPDSEGHLASWSFDTARIKDSLSSFLESHGWSKRKGFFGRMFS